VFTVGKVPTPDAGRLPSRLCSPHRSVLGTLPRLASRLGGTGAGRAACANAIDPPLAVRGRRYTGPVIGDVVNTGASAGDPRGVPRGVVDFPETVGLPAEADRWPSDGSGCDADPGEAPTSDAYVPDPPELVKLRLDVGACPRGRDGTVRARRGICPRAMLPRRPRGGEAVGGKAAGVGIDVADAPAVSVPVPLLTLPPLDCRSLLIPRAGVRGDVEDPMDPYRSRGGSVGTDAGDGLVRSGRGGATLTGDIKGALDVCDEYDRCDVYELVLAVEPLRSLAVAGYSNGPSSTVGVERRARRSGSKVKSEEDSGARPGENEGERGPFVSAIGPELPGDESGPLGHDPKTNPGAGPV